MGLTQGERALASDFVDLKARVKAEMNRRCRNGSLVAYAGTNYDYTTPLEAGGKINLEHVNKIIEPLNAITS